MAVDTGGGEALSNGAAVVKVDCTAPIVSVGPESASQVDAGDAVAPAAVSAADAHAGVAETQVEVELGDGIWRSYGGPLQAAVGSAYRFRARATDAAGNVSAWSVPSAPTYVRAGPTPGDDPPAQHEERPDPAVPSAPDPHDASEVSTPRFHEAPLIPPTFDPPTGQSRHTEPPGQLRLRLTTARRLAGGRKLRIAGTTSNAAPRSTVLITVRDARGRRNASKRVAAVRGTFALTLRLRRAAGKAIRVHAQLTTPDGRVVTATKIAR